LIDEATLRKKLKEKYPGIEKAQLDGIVKVTLEVDKAKTAAETGVEDFFDAMSKSLDLGDTVAQLSALKHELNDLSIEWKDANDNAYRFFKAKGDLTQASRLHADALAAETKKAEFDLAISVRAAAQLQESLKSGKLTTAQVAEHSEELQKLNEVIADEVTALEKAAEKQEAYNGLAETTKATIEATTGISAKWKKTMWGQMLQTGDLSKATDQLVNSMRQQITVANVVGSTIMKVKQMTLAAAYQEDAATISFARATNATAAMGESMLFTARHSRSLGMGAKDVNEHTSALHTTILSFSEMTDANAVKSLQTASLELSNLGAASASSSKMFAHLIDNMSMSTDDAIKFRDELNHLGEQLHVGTGQMVEDFVKSRKTLLLYGDAGTKVFKNLAAKAKALRVNVDQLTGAFENQFNTFEGAFTTVGRLNSLLNESGVQIDATSMMQMEVGDRAEYLTQKLKGTRLATQALHGPMSKYHKMAIASALGTQDMDLVTKVLKGDLQELAKTTDFAADTWENFMRKGAEMKGKSQVEVAKQLEQVFYAFAVKALPLLRAFGSVLQWINEVMDTPIIGDFIKVIFGVVTVTALLLPIYATLKYLFGSMIPAIALQIKLGWIRITQGKAAAAVAAKEAAAKGVSASANVTLTVSLTGLWPALLAAGAAAMMFGAGIFFAAKGIKDLSGAGIAALIGLFIGFGVALYFLATAATGSAVAVPILLGIGAAFLMMGLAVGIAAAGMSLMFGSLKDVEGAQLLAIATGLYSLTGAMIAMAGIGIFGGFFAAGPLNMIADFVDDLQGKNVAALTSLATILERIDKINFNNFAKAATGIKNMVATISKDIKGEQIVKVERVMRAIAPVAMATPSEIGTPSGTTTRASEATVATTAAPDAAAAELAEIRNAIKDLTRQLSEFSNRPVKLVMDNIGIATLAKNVAKHPPFPQHG